MPRKTGGGGIFLVAVILSLACAYGFYLFMDKIQQGSQKNWLPVVVAVVDIPAKTKITQEMIEVKARPKDLIAADACTDKNQVVGRFVRDKVRTIEQVRASDLFAAGDQNALDLLIPEGMRAVSIGANEIKAVGNGVKPGHFVDITATYTDPMTKQQITHMILQRAKVLWVNKGQADQRMEGGAESSMTLLVRPEEVELLAAAEKAGVIRVALRSTHDEQILERPIVPGLVFGKQEPVALPMTDNTTNAAPEKTVVYLQTGQRGVRVWRGDKEHVIQMDR
jgi:pilus assembly protein CpaB